MTNEKERATLHRVLESTSARPPEVFTWLSILGLIIALMLLIVGYNRSTIEFLLFVAASLVVGVLSIMEGRIWSALARRRFVRNALDAGLSADDAADYWDNLDDDEEGEEPADGLRD